MSKPTPVQVATIAATLLPKGIESGISETRWAIAKARELIRLAGEPPQETTAERHMTTAAAARQLGYVSRNYRSQMKKLVDAVWRHLHRGGEGPEHYFAYHEARGWDASTLKELSYLKRAYHSQAARRPHPRQSKSAG